VAFVCHQASVFILRRAAVNRWCRRPCDFLWRNQVEQNPLYNDKEGIDKVLILSVV